MKRIIVGTLAIASLYAGNIDVIVPKDTLPSKTIELIDENGVSHTPLMQNNGKYIGVGIGRTNAGSTKGISSTLLFGYMFSSYFGIEFRYSTLLSDVRKNGEIIGDNIDNYGIYIKEMIPLDISITPFALLGYGKTKYGNYSDSQMQWGAGLDYQTSKNLGFTLDFESYYSGNFNGAFIDDIDVDSFKLNSRYSF